MSLIFSKKPLLFLFFLVVFIPTNQAQEISIDFSRDSDYSDPKSKFEHISSDILSLGISSKPCYGKVTIESLDLSYGLFTVFIDNSLLDEIEIYKDSSMKKLIYRGGQVCPLS